MKDLYLAAVDIGGTNVRVSVSDKNKILYKVSQPSIKKGNNKTIPNQVENLIDHVLKKLRISKHHLFSIGISSCGPFDKQDRIVATNLCGGIVKNKLKNNWKYIPLKQELSKRYKSIKLGNDAAASALAEKLFGSGKNLKNFVYVTWSTGIGTGAFVDNKQIFGKNNNAMHAGHMYLSETGQKCNCSQEGDFESLTSGVSLEKIYGKSPEILFKDCKKGNKKARSIVEKAAKDFARGLASINAILDTELFILGGSIMKNKDILLPLIKKEFYNGFKPLTKDVKIIVSSLGDSVGDLGALSLVMPVYLVKKWQKTKPWKHAPKVEKLEL
jgi:glucokinase